MYTINEIFYSIQGEGVRAGTPNVFIRFSGCNLQCKADGPEGFDCDTEFVSGRRLETNQLLDEVIKTAPQCKAIIFTGGEPALQIDKDLISAFKNQGYYLAIETNGTKELPRGLDWITVSPKTAEHTLHQMIANEVKYVRHKGMAIPRPTVKADHLLISPSFQPDGTVTPQDLQWSIDLVKTNPPWRLSLQLHKWLRQR